MNNSLDLSKKTNENTKNATNLLFILGLLVQSWQMQDYQHIQLYLLLFFPLGWLLIYWMGRPANKLSASNLFMCLAIVIFFLTLTSHWWSPSKQMVLFQDNDLLSWSLFGLLCFAGYAGVYFSRTGQQNRWHRYALGLSLFILIRWMYLEEFTYRFQEVGFLLFILAAIPLFWNFLPQYTHRIYELILASKKEQPDSTWLNILSDKEAKAELHALAVSKIQSDQLLHQLFLNDKVSEGLAEAALRRIKDEDVLLQVVLDEEEAKKYREIAIDQMVNWTSKLLALRQIKDTAIQAKIIDEIPSTSTVETIFLDSSFPDEVRQLLVPKIASEQAILDVLWNGEDKSPAFSQALVNHIQSPETRKNLLLDDAFPEPIRLLFFTNIADYELFQLALAKLSGEQAKMQAIDSVKSPHILHEILQDQAWDSSIQKKAAMELLLEDVDLLSPNFMQISLSQLLPELLTQNQASSQIIQLLRNVTAFWGQFTDEGVLESFYPSELVINWYRDWLEVASDSAENIQVHWAVSNCFSILPNAQAIPVLQQAYDKARTVLKQETGELHRVAKAQALFLPEMTVANLLKALGFCAAKDASYTGFDRDETILAEIKPLEDMIKRQSLERNNLLKDFRALIDRLQEEEHLADYQIVTRHDYREMEQQIESRDQAIKDLMEKRDDLADQLSVGNVLMRVAANGQEFNTYIRQHACAGLIALTESSFLDEKAKLSISELLDSLQKDPAQEEFEMELEEEGAIDLEAVKADRTEQTVDPSFSIYEMRLMPHAKKGEVSYVFYSTLTQLSKNQTSIRKDQLYKTIVALCEQLPDAIQFFQQYPLKVMPRAMRNRLASYREQGYNLNYWTRYTPPKDVAGNVKERYIEIEDFTRPNSMGIVYNLFVDPLLLIPVIYHEYQHYKGIKNEAHVWLKEQYFLRHLIAAYAPNDENQLQAYLNYFSGSFFRIQDLLSLSLLKTDFSDPPQLQVFNAMITHFYGKQLNGNEAHAYALRQIDYENRNIYFNNVALRWDPIKKFPQFAEPKTDWETQLLTSIIKARKSQRNTITIQEVNQILNEDEITIYKAEWEHFTKKVSAIDTWFAHFPDLGSLYQNTIDQAYQGDLLLFKS